MSEELGVLQENTPTCARIADEPVANHAPIDKWNAVPTSQH